MYGGLFGDLPATKKSKTTNPQDDDDSKKKTSDITTTSTTETGTSVERRVETPSSAASLFPAQAGGKSKAKKTTVSLVKRIGSAGTSMAFVPTSIKKKANVAAGTGRQSSSQSIQHAVSHSSRVETKTEDGDEIRPTPKLSTTTHPHETTDIKPTGPCDVDDAENVQPDMMNEQEQDDEVRKLHDSVVDPYDPYLPNDLLEYWERQSLAEERRMMEQEARERLQQQQALRQELARPQVQQHENEVQSSPSIPAVGRGRGGISNLPAWMLKQIQQQQESHDGPTGQP